MLVRAHQNLSIGSDDVKATLQPVRISWCYLVPRKAAMWVKTWGLKWMAHQTYNMTPKLSFMWKIWEIGYWGCYNFSNFVVSFGLSACTYPYMKSKFISLLYFLSPSLFLYAKVLWKLQAISIGFLAQFTATQTNFFGHALHNCEVLISTPTKVACGNWRKVQP